MSRRDTTKFWTAPAEHRGDGTFKQENAIGMTANPRTAQSDLAPRLPPQSKTRQTDHHTK